MARSDSYLFRTTAGLSIECHAVSGKPLPYLRSTKARVFPDLRKARMLPRLARRDSGKKEQPDRQG